MIQGDPQDFTSNGLGLVYSSKRKQFFLLERQMSNRTLSICVAGLLPVAFSTIALAATNFVQKNLVADAAGVADNTDPNLVGTWGISASPTSPFWVSNAATGTSTLYNTAGVPNTAVVANVPPSGASKLKTGIPTGQVWSGFGAGNFEIAAGRPAT